MPPRPRPDAGAPAESPARAVRITDVAAEAGVSAITVSRALNTSALLSAPTLRRVLAAVEKLGYVPNLTAGALSSRRWRMIVAIVPTIASPMYAEALQAFTDVLSQAGYHVVLGLGGFDGREEEQLITTLLGRQPEGLLLVGTVQSAGARRRLDEATIPIVEIWGGASPGADLQVGFNHAGVGEAVADHLCDRGYRAFGVVSSDDARAMERLDGFRRRLRRRGSRRAGCSIAFRATPRRAASACRLRSSCGGRRKGRRAAPSPGLAASHAHLCCIAGPAGPCMEMPA